MPTPEDFRRLDLKLQRLWADHRILFEAIAIGLFVAMCTVGLLLRWMFEANR